MPRARAILSLVRFDSSAIGFLTVFVPVFARTGDLLASTRMACPLLFIWMSTFLANDLDDLERDRINHPARPLPAGHLSPIMAVALYFVCVAAALIATRTYLSAGVAFWYYVLIVQAISYGYIVDWLPSGKAVYVAAGVSIPVVVVASVYGERKLLVVAISTFLVTLGRELCMDVLDRAADRPSRIGLADPVKLARIALALQAVGVGIVSSLAFRDPRLALSVSAMIALLAASWICWFRLSRQKMAVALMKGHFVVGLTFLL